MTWNFIHGHSLSAIDVLVISFVWSTEESCLGLSVERLCKFAYEIVAIKNSDSSSKFKKKQQSKLGSYELIKEVRANNFEKVQEILKMNPLSVNSQDLGKMNVNCAHIAVINQNMKILELLVSYGVDLECQNEGGMTPVFFSIDRHDTIDCLEYLIGLGVNISHWDWEGWTLVY